MSKYVQVNRMPDGWRRQFKQIAMPDCKRHELSAIAMFSAIRQDERASFLELAGHLARTIRQAILVDQVSSDRASRATVLDLLEQHITKNIVKVISTMRVTSVCLIAQSDWPQILSASYWYSAGVGALEFTLFVLLWRPRKEEDSILPRSTLRA
jgi:hypothetical protein